MKMTAYLYWVSTDYEREGGHYALHPDGSMDGFSGASGKWTLVGQQEVDFDVKPFDARELLIDGLKRQKAELIRETTQKAEKIEEKIQQLLALPASVAA